MIARTFLLVAWLDFTACSWRVSSAEQLTPPVKTPANKNDPAVVHPFTRDRDAWRELFLQKDFAGLEKVAATLLRDRPKYDGGTPHISNFCSIAFNSKLKDEDYQSIPPILDEWLKAYPDSIAAHLVAANFWYKYGFFARGGNSAANTPAEQLQLFAERCRKASDHLDEVEKLTESPDPVYYRLRIDSSFGLSRKPDVNWVYEALKTDPQDYEAVQAMTHALLPRWFGKPGELREFADEIAQRTKQSCGEMLYAYPALALRSVDQDVVLALHQFDWPRVKQGLQDLTATFPQAKPRFDDIALFAWLAGDTKSALEAVQQIGDAPLRLPPWQDVGVTYEDFHFRVNEEFLKGDQKKLIPNGVRDIHAMSVMQDNLLVTVDGHSFVRVFDYHRGTLEIAQRLAQLNAYTVSILPSSGIAVSGAQVGTGAMLFNLTNFEQTFLEEPKLQVTRTAFSPQGDFLVLVNQVGSLEILNRESQKKLHEITVDKPRRVENLAFSRKGDLLALACETGELVVLNVVTGKQEALMQLSKRSATSVAWSDRQLAVGTFEGQVFVFDWPEQKEVASWKGKPAISCLQFSPDNDRLAFGMNGSTLKRTIPNSLYVWKPGVEPAPKPLSGHKFGVTAIQFAEQGKTLISAGRDWTIRYWDVPE